MFNRSILDQMICVHCKDPNVTLKFESEEYLSDRVYFNCTNCGYSWNKRLDELILIPNEEI